MLNMEKSKKLPKSANPCANSNIFSYAIYKWTSGIFSIGQNRSLEFSDFYEPLNEHSASYLAEKINQLWQRKLKLGSPNLTLVLLQCFWKQITINLSCLLLSDCFFKVIQPLLLGKLISYYAPGTSDMTSKDLYLCTLGFIICSVVSVAIRHPFSFSNSHLGMKARVGCCSLIYRKTLKISNADAKCSSSGQIVNLLAKDVSTFDYSSLLLLYLIVAPIQAIIMTILMYQKIGISAVIGNLCLIIIIPFQFLLGGIIKKKKKESMPLTDNRLNFMTEVLSGIKVIKMFTWEKPFTKQMKLLRRMEIGKLMHLSYARALVLSFVFYSTPFALYMSILAYVLLGNTIAAENIFVVICFYSYIKHALCNIFPIAISNLAEVRVAIKRLQSFLLQKELETLPNVLINGDFQNDMDEENIDETVIPFIGNKGEKEIKIKWSADIELKEESVNIENENDSNEISNSIDNNCIELMNIKSEHALKLESVYMKWDPNQYEFNLSNISMKIPHGSLVAIIGEVGSGKSSLFYTILKETPISSGVINIDGSVSYASQDPWLFNSSIRQNILFGSELNQSRYNEILKKCILEKDISSMTNGDETVVGEKGMKISGGQQARINLARAIYRNSDIYLLDDPLSAVDCHVGQKLFDDCIVDFLKDKTRFLITHQYQYLSKVDHIILLDNGYVIAQGSFNDLMQSSPTFQIMIKNKENNLDDILDEVKSDENSCENREINVKDDLSDEQQKIGSVDTWVYASYISAGGPFILFVFFFVLFVFAQMLASYSDYWITTWINAEEKAFVLMTNHTSFVRNSNFNSNNLFDNTTQIYDENEFLELDYMKNRNHYIYVYSGIIVLLIAVGILRVLMFFWLCLRASIRLHNKLFKAVIHATMRFFHITPAGRILNRFIYDMSMVDEILPKIIFDCLQIFGQVIGIMFLIVFVNIWLLIPIMISIGLFIYLRDYYTKVARSVKRLEAIARSPIFSHLNTSFQGLSTIRAFGVQKVLEKEFNQHQDLHSSVWFMFLGTSRAFGLWLDGVCMGFLIIIVLILVIAGNESAGNIGLAITQAIGIIGIFQYAIRTLTEVETLMTSVERIIEYQDVEQEPPLLMELDKKLSSEWPLHGNIKFENVSSRYAPKGNVVLKNLSFNISSKEKVGVVGRSGSGKTSIINSIFRMIYVNGNIKIDETDIRTIGLHKLRNNISVIPQEPILFSGTLRYNLDPFSKCDDETLWTALEQVEMKELIIGLKDGLDTEISGSNSSFSVGQRQLLCLARAIISRNCILILDEATANVDPKTDALIQKTIREEFENYTVITIAHRLQTIMDSDKVMVMESGKIIEFDHPHILLQNRDSKFSSMVRTTNDVGENLYEIAEKSYKEKYQQKISDENEE